MTKYRRIKARKKLLQRRHYRKTDHHSTDKKKLLESISITRGPSTRPPSPCIHHLLENFIHIQKKTYFACFTTILSIAFISSCLFLFHCSNMLVILFLRHSCISKLFPELYYSIVYYYTFIYLYVKIHNIDGGGLYE